MSPEQCEASGTDHRTDVWSLGVVLYEMISGQHPFKGDYDQAIMYSILNEDPEPITALRTGVPMELEVAVNKAIAKSPDERYQNTDDLVVDLKALQKRLQSGREKVIAAESSAPSKGVGAQRAAPASWLPWLTAAGAAVGALVFAILYFTALAPEQTVRRFSFTPDSLFSQFEAKRAAISPDGRWIVYASDESPAALWVRPIDSEAPQKLEGTAGATYGAFWSPDSRFIGFAADGQLKKIAVERGPAVVLCELPGTVFAGGAWKSDDETIVFSSGSGFPVLYEVPVTGGTYKAFMEPLSNEKGPGNVEPHFLPPKASSDSLLLAIGRPTDKNVECERFVRPRNRGRVAVRCKRLAFTTV